MRRIRLREWEQLEVSLSEAEVGTLTTEFRRAVMVRVAGPGRYRVRARAYVGTIVTSSLEVRIVPKCGLRNLLWMLGWAHGVAQHFDQTVDLQAIDDPREFLLAIFAEQVHRLVRSGVRRGYVEAADDLAVLRGRLDLDRHLRRVPSTALRIACRFEDYTADLPINQVVADTLRRIGTSEHGPTAGRLRRLRQAFAGLARRRFSPTEIDVLEYDRLTAHYRPIHALCRILLEATGIEHEDGELPMGSILLDMNRLFERFVAAWLDEHLPEGWKVRPQVSRTLDRGQTLNMYPDIVLERWGRPRVVVDTKYKIETRGVPARDDAYQALAYCRALELSTCVLVYPDRDRPRRFVVADGCNEIRTDGFLLDRGVDEIERGLVALRDRLLAAAVGRPNVEPARGNL